MMSLSKETPEGAADLGRGNGLILYLWSLRYLKNLQVEPSPQTQIIHATLLLQILLNKNHTLQSSPPALVWFPVTKIQTTSPDWSVSHSPHPLFTSQYQKNVSDSPHLLAIGTFWAGDQQERSKATCSSLVVMHVASRSVCLGLTLGPATSYVTLVKLLKLCSSVFSSPNTRANNGTCLVALLWGISTLMWRKCSGWSLACCRPLGKSCCAWQPLNLGDSKSSLRVIAFFPAPPFLLLNFRVRDLQWQDSLES